MFEFLRATPGVAPETMDPNILKDTKLAFSILRNMRNENVSLEDIKDLVVNSGGTVEKYKAIMGRLRDSNLIVKDTDWCLSETGDHVVESIQAYSSGLVSTQKLYDLCAGKEVDFTEEDEDDDLSASESVEDDF